MKRIACLLLIPFITGCGTLGPATGGSQSWIGEVIHGIQGIPFEELIEQYKAEEKNVEAEHKEYTEVVPPSAPAPAPVVKIKGVTILSSTQSLDGFVWKPGSENDGRLVVLVPKKHKDIGIVKGGIYKKPSFSAELVEAGAYQNYDKEVNGGRGHFRFKKAGSGYGSDVYFVFETKQGVFAYPIPKPGQRYG